jgi:hypothetical protein
MNSILQCLNNTELLSQFMLQDKHLEGIASSKSRGEFANMLASLFRSMWRTNQPIQPSRFLARLRAYMQAHTRLGSATFRHGQQHDAEEFLNFVLTELGADVCVGPKTMSKVDEQSSLGTLRCSSFFFLLYFFGLNFFVYWEICTFKSHHFYIACKVSFSFRTMSGTTF